MAGENFSITFGGRSVQTGRMSVRDLAPSLIALADAVGVASRLTNPELPEPDLEITAQRRGSYAVDLILNGEQQAWTAIQDAMFKPQVEASATLITLVGAILGAIKFIQWVKGRKIQKTAPITNGHVRMTLEDGSSMDLPKDSVILTGDVVFRRSVRAVLEPLAHQRVEEIRFEHQSTEPVVLTSEDVPSFDQIVEKKLINESTGRMVLQPILVAFQPGNKWRFTDRQVKFFATVKDEDFLAKIKSGVEEFVSTDFFICTVKTETWRMEDGSIQTERFIMKVLEHNRATHQMYFGETDDDESQE